VAEALKPSHQIVFQPILIETVKIVRTQLAIAAVTFNEMVNDHQDTVGNRHHGSFLSSVGCQAVILGPQVSALIACCTPSHLTEHSSEPGTPLPRFARSPLPGTLVISWTHTGPMNRAAVRMALSVFVEVY